MLLIVVITIIYELISTIPTYHLLLLSSYPSNLSLFIFKLFSLLTTIHSACCTLISYVRCAFALIAIVISSHHAISISNLASSLTAIISSVILKVVATKVGVFAIIITGSSHYPCCRFSTLTTISTYYSQSPTTTHSFLTHIH